MFNFDVVAAHQEYADSQTPELLPGSELRQVFTSLENALYRIELLFSATDVAGSGRLLFALYRGSHAKPRKRSHLPPLVIGSMEVSRLTTGGWRSFEFSPLDQTEGQTFTIYIKLEGEGRVQLRRSADFGDELYLQSAPLKGVLAYRAFAVRDVVMFRNFQLLREELQAESISVRHMPVMLRLEISKACNQQCIMCAHGQADFQLKRTDVKHMSLEVFERVVAPLVRTASVLVAFGLGEPFLNKDFIAILRRAKRENPLVHIFVSTNGTLLSEETCEAIIEDQLIDVLQISIDGACEETYAKIRRRPRPGNDYRTTMESLSRVIRLRREKEAHFPKVKVEMLVNKHTAGEILTFVEKMVQAGVDMVAFDSVKGDYPELGLAECDVPAIRADLQSAIMYARDSGVSIEGPLLTEIESFSVNSRDVDVVEQISD